MSPLLLIFFVSSAIVVPTIKSQISQEQRNALLDIYNSLDGPSWPCSWNITQLMNGYVVDNCIPGGYIASVKDESVTINGTTHHTDIVNGLTFELISDTVSGTLPSSLSALSTLTSLRIHGYGISGTLPNTICNLTQLMYLTISNTNITGTIPSCLFENNPNLTLIYIQNNSFYDAIPESIGSLTKLQDLTLKANKQMIQPIPNITNLINLEIVSFQGYFTGTISDSFCHLQKLGSLEFLSMPYLSGSIPECLFNNPNLQHIYITSTNIEGSIPDTICSAWLRNIYLENNLKLIGSLPKCQHNNWTELDMVRITQNPGLTGNIPSAYLCSPSPFALIHISDNVQMERTEVPSCWNNASNLWVINMPNSKLYGTLPSNIINSKYLQSLVLHNNDIYGSVPSAFKAQGHFQIITLYNNRLSCSIPNSSLIQTCAKNIGTSNCTSLVLSQNLFQCEKNNQFDSYFSSAVNLFVTPSDKTKSWILLIISCLCFVYYIIKSFMNKQNEVYAYKQGQFIEDIELFQSNIGDWKLLSLIMVLLIIYPSCANYYKCSPIHTWFSMSWYYEENINSWINWCLMIICVGINGMFCLIVTKCYVIQLESHTATRNTRINSQSLLGSSIVIEYDVKMERNGVVICKSIAKFITFLLLYLLGITMIILYLFCESLPDDNTLISSKTLREFITRAMAIILAINNSFVVPRLVRAFEALIAKECATNKTMEIITMLRTVNYLIVPIFASIFLLNDCGRWWTKSWIQCDENHESQFDIIDKSDLRGGYLLTHDQVCDPNNLVNINWNKCTRSFFYQWTYVVVTKFIVMIFTPFLMMGYKWIKNEMIIKYHKYKGNDKEKSGQIEIDSAYTGIITSFESVIAFSIISPLLIPIVLVAVDANIFCYNIMINKFKWKLTSYKDLYSSFPTQLLIIGIICGQLLTVSFFVFAIDNNILYSIYISCLCVIDCFYLWLCCKSRRVYS